MVYKVLVNGFAKTGNHWARFVVSHYFNILKGNEKVLSYKELGEWCSPKYARGKPFIFREGYTLSSFIIPDTGKLGNIGSDH